MKVLDCCKQWWFFKKILGGGTKGLNLPSILEEALVLDKYLGIFVNYTCFSWEKVYKKIEAQAKKWFSN